MFGGNHRSLSCFRSYTDCVTFHLLSDMSLVDVVFEISHCSD